MADAILVLNAGSSSLKFSVFLDRGQALELLLRGKIESLHNAPRFVAYDAQRNSIGQHNWPDGESVAHDAAIQFLFQWGRDGQLAGHQIKAAGHRVAHGGVKFKTALRVDEQVLDQLQEIVRLAPLHQPHNLAAIRAVEEAVPGLPQVACFDTSFHRDQPVVEHTFALPRRLTEEGVQRYGFHGLSYEYIASRLPEVDARAATGRTVVAHLGNGASMCAMLGGRSVASTMGMTAIDGLPMGTRSGAIDPGVLIYLMDEHQLGARELEELLYQESGLLGVSGISNDMRVLLESPVPRAAEAIDLFVYRIGRELGSLAAALGGLDALVFTAGIGEHAAPIRARVCQDAAWLGLELDDSKNNAGGPCISRPNSRVSGWVIPTNEELMIARHTQRVLARAGRVQTIQ